MIGRPELVEDPAYATPGARIKHLDEVFGVVEAWTKNYTKFEVLDKLNEIDVPCGPIMSTKDLIEDESLKGRMIVDVEHPERGTFKTVGCPLVLSDTPVEITASPLLGAHSEEILSEIGWTGSSAKELQAAGVL
jgi:formyl-CoA transferase